LLKQALASPNRSLSPQERLLPLSHQGLRSPSHIREEELDNLLALLEDAAQDNQVLNVELKKVKEENNQLCFNLFSNSIDEASFDIPIGHNDMSTKGHVYVYYFILEEVYVS